MPYSPTTLRLENVTTGYQSKRHRTPVGINYNAELPAGRLTCLLGVNGSGKSTLLRSLSKSQKILEGEITIDGRNISLIPNSEISKLIGVVLTDKIETPNMSVEELISLGRSPYNNFWGRLSDEDYKITKEAMESVNITSLKSRKVSSLSDGERQKVMVAKTLAQQTPVILLDEPTAFLDYPSRIELMMLMRRLAREKGITVLLSTHDIPMAMQLADYIWLVNEKRELITGLPDELGERGDIGKCFDRNGVVYDNNSKTFIMK